MNPTAISATQDDAQLVQHSLAGDREAFGEIVVRYQSLVCALTYSATGSRTRSEDLAQETFVTAWKKLRDLNDPGRLRSWLCGIARNLAHGELRKLGRQPVHKAETLDTAGAVVSAEPQPPAQTVSNEELAILWREVGRLPEVYREPLILFYREHKSVERVAAALELTPDAAMQRLTRGRRLLRERMLAFVETTLERTNPGSDFTLAVEAALPILAGTAPMLGGGALGSGGVAAKGSLLTFLLVWAAPLVGVFAAIGISWADLRSATTHRERRFVARWMLALWTSAAGFVLALPAAARFAHRAGLDQRDDWLVTAPRVAVWFGFSMIAVTLITFLLRGRAALRENIAAGMPATDSPPKPPSIVRQCVISLGAITSLYWVEIYVAWVTGDRVVAGAIAGVTCLLAFAPFAAVRLLGIPMRREGSGRYLSCCGLVFLGLLNWRLNTWLAPVYDVDAAGMARLLPPALLHVLSSILVLWTAMLVFITRPDRKKS